jgi:hypothetical protein
MYGRRPPPPSSASRFKRFDVIFGGVFLVIGLLALTAAGLLYFFLHDDPKLNAPIWAIIAGPVGVGTIFTLLGGTFFLMGLRKLNKETYLLRVGTTTEATVVAIEPTGTRVNNQRLWHVRYVYDDMIGGTYEGLSGHLSPDDAQSFSLGGKAFIRYDPQKPSSSMWLGREELPY